MLIQAISLIILTIFGMINILFNLTPLFLMLFFALLNTSDFLGNAQIMVFVAIVSSLCLMILVYLYEILQFYTNFRMNARLSGLAKGSDTKYHEMLDIFIEDLLSQAKLDKNWLKFYTIADKKIKIYSFANSKMGVIVLSTGMLDKLIELVKEDKVKAMKGFEFIIGHELSHIKNEHFISSDFFTSNIKLGIKIRFIYKIIFTIIGKMFKIIPFLGKYIARFFEYFNVFIDFFFSISSKLMELVYRGIRASLFQLQELEADKESVSIFGPETISSFFEFFPKYSNSFSTHMLKDETRFTRVKDIILSKEKFKFTEDNKDTLLACYITLCLIFICVLVLLFMLKSDLQFKEFWHLLAFGMEKILNNINTLYQKFTILLKPLKNLLF